MEKVGGPVPRGVWAAAAAVTVVLVVFASRYGYHRDELYFAMLPPAWGYLDQPPLVPLLARLLGDDPLLLRLPAALCAAASVVLVALIARELGAGRATQVVAAWAYAGTTAVLGFGHLLLTSTLDLVLWPLICLALIRAEVRHDRRWWLVAGVVTGLATFNKLLVVLLPLGVLVGLVVLGPRARLRDPWVIGAGAASVVLALPNIVHQATHGWPQLEMGQALAESNAGETRWFMWVFLVVVLGPPLVPIWWAGIRWLWARPELRMLVAAFVLVVVFTFLSGAQPHYSMFLLVVLLAAGAAAMGERLQAPWWRAWFVVNAVVAALVSLPLLPLQWLGATPIPAMSPIAADTVGWPTYARQVRDVWEGLSPEDQERAVVLAANYGEAGAVERFTGLPVVSGHNALHALTDADDLRGTEVAVVVGEQDRRLAAAGVACERRDELDNGFGVDNEEQGIPVSVCRGLADRWEDLWPALRHLD